MRACRLRAAFLFDHVVLGPRHAAFSRTLGDRAIVTGYSVIWPSGKRRYVSRAR